MAFTFLSSNTVGSGGAASVSITGIPATYSALRLIYETQGGTTGALEDLVLQIGFNGLSSYGATTNAWGKYRMQLDGYQNGGGSAILNYKRGSGAGATDVYGDLCMTWGTNYTSSYKTAGYADIFEYREGNNCKVVNSYYTQAVNGSAYYSNTGMFGNIWDIATAINSVQLRFNTGNIPQHSTFELYGVD